MQTKILTAALAALLLAGAARAEDPKPAPAPATTTQSVMTFFRHLKESLAQSAVQGERKKSPRHAAASVAAVRGASQSSSLADPNEPVLKGDVRSKKDKAAMDEDAEISRGVDLVLAGKTDEGVKALEDFKAKHPKSRSLDKVQQAIEQAKALPAAEKPAETTAPAAEAPKAEAPKADAPKADAPKPDAPAQK